MTRSSRKLKVLRILILGGIYGISCYLLIIRMLWMYDSQVMWWVYQILHLALFFCFFRVCALHSWKINLLLAVAVSMIIGWMPYGLWVSIILNPDPSLFSDATGGLPTTLRLFLEVLFFPLLQIFLMTLGLAAKNLNGHPS